MRKGDAPSAAARPLRGGAGLGRASFTRRESGAPAPRRVELAKDTLSADSAYRLACAGTAMLWRSDFQNARLMLQALQRRIEAKPPKAAARAAAKIAASTPEEVFHLHRQAQSQRSRTLSALVIQVEGDYSIPLRRAPDWKEALTEAWGPATGEAQVVSLRELLGVVGAHEWRGNCSAGRCAPQPHSPALRRLLAGAR